MPGTRVAAKSGWRLVEELEIGEELLTFDNGYQRVAGVVRTPVWSDALQVADRALPVVVPTGALGNRDAIVLPPAQGVMLECDAVRDPMGDPFAILSARALEGFCGLARQPPPQPVDLISLQFATEEVIYVDGGLRLHCRPTPLPPQGSDPAELLYSVMPNAEARALLAGISDVRAALTRGADYVLRATALRHIASAPRTP